MSKIVSFIKSLLFSFIFIVSCFVLTGCAGYVIREVAESTSEDNSQSISEVVSDTISTVSADVASDASHLAHKAGDVIGSAAHEIALGLGKALGSLGSLNINDVFGEIKDSFGTEDIEITTSEEDFFEAHENVYGPYRCISVKDACFQMELSDDDLSDLELSNDNPIWTFAGVTVNTEIVDDFIADALLNQNLYIEYGTKRTVSEGRQLVYVYLDRDGFPFFSKHSC